MSTGQAQVLVAKLGKEQLEELVGHAWVRLEDTELIKLTPMLSQQEGHDVSRLESQGLYRLRLAAHAQHDQRLVQLEGVHVGHRQIDNILDSQLLLG